MPPPLIGFPPKSDLPSLCEESFQRHRASPQPGYRLNRRLELTEAISHRTVVYLDTRYWIFFRDVHLGRSQIPGHIRLFEALRTRVCQGKALCPIADGQFLELVRQTDPDTRLATAQVMDELSQGVAVASAEDRAVMELRDLLGHLSGGAPQRPSWAPFTRSGYLIGDVTPIPDGFPQEDHLFIQNAFDDKMWTIGLVEILETIGDSLEEIPTTDYGRMATEFNEGKFAHAHQLKSFRQTYLDEVYGALDGYADLIGEALELVGLVSGKHHGDAITRTAAAKAVIPVLKDGFAKDVFTVHLPAFDVMATLHAAMRWDRARKYRPNDWLDFRHALGAIPHADLFLTERALAALVSLPHLGLRSRYKTAAYSDPLQALAALVALVA